MNVNRRTVIAAGASVAIPAMSADKAEAAISKGAIFIFDSRLAASRQFAEGAHRLSARALDICKEDENLWRKVRAAAVSGNAIVGLTSWSQYILVRGYMEEAGKRIRYETPAKPGTRDKASPFLWIMN